jgi:lysozyme
MINWFKSMFMKKDKPRKTNQAGIDLIKKFEGYSNIPYTCSAGKRTIGYGHVILEGEHYTTITKEQGEQLLKVDLMKAEKCLMESCYADLADNQFAALVSFIFNVGCGNFKRSTLLRLLNNGMPIDIVAKQFDRWKFAGGKELAGLLRRREAEKELFLKNGKAA